MRLTKLTLFDFKNYSKVQLGLTGDILCFFGKNGSGKTNLLDAIHYLSFTKSAINSNDAMTIRHGQTQFFVSGEFKRSGIVSEVACSFQQGSKKSVTEDGQVCARFSRHIGKYPVVLIAPNDIGLIWDGGEVRRRFIDNLLCQIDAAYLNHLIVYAESLKQRNGMLKIFSERGYVDRDLMEAWDAKLIPAAHYIFARRKQLLEDLFPIFETHYRFLAGTTEEQVGIVYRSDLATQDFKQALNDHLKRDLLLQRTGSGIHRDDFLFLLNGNELKRFGSQGQQKCFLVALKLAEFQVIAGAKQIKPLLLLDDIFDKLDEDRIHKLMVLVANGTFGQLLITDARAVRGREILEETGIPAQLFEVKDNQVVQR